MGWYIFFGILIFLSIPLFIPIILKARWDEEAMEWSVHVGFLQVAPDTKTRLERWKRNLSRVFTPIGKVLKFFFSIVVLLIKALLWPLKKIRQFISSSRAKKRTTDDEPSSFDFSQDEMEAEEPADHPPMDSEESPSTDSDETKETVLDVPGESDHLMVEELSAEDTAPPAEEFEWDSDDEIPADEETEAEEKKKTRKEFKNPFDAINKKLDNFKSLKAKLDIYLDYYRRYSPLGKRILRKVFLLLRRYFHAFHFQRLKVVCKTGGDPAVLGAISGWHYALGYTIHPRLPESVVFLPDYEEQSVSLSGSLNISVWIWPIRFVMPTLAFIFGLPWIRIYKTVREFQKRDGQS